LYILSDSADKDIVEIATYTKETWGNVQCSLYLDNLKSAFAKLVNNPKIGIKTNDVRIGYYKYFVGRHIILYRVSVNYDIEIIRVLHQSMDVESQI